jgi:aryl sulfotransferase
MSAPFVWLASYPKSGNTWLRMFLANRLHVTRAPLGINDIDIGFAANSRRVFEDVVGVAASELSDADIDRLRPEAYRLLAARASDIIFSKVHDAYVPLPDGRPLFPAEVTRAAIYVVRHPLDVAISCAHFFGADPDTIIERMGDDRYALSDSVRGFHPLLRQHLGRWCAHVLGWADETPFPTLMVRYEDMWRRPTATFSTVSRFLGWPDAPDAVERAVAACRFERLQEQERAHGFRENHSSAPLFFRRGRMEQWRGVLSAAQVDRVVRDHHAVMQRFGYLGADGVPAVCADMGGAPQAVRRNGQ